MYELYFSKCSVPPNFSIKLENSYHSAVFFKVVKKIGEIKYFDAKIKGKIWQYVLLFCNFSDFTM